MPCVRHESPGVRLLCFIWIYTALTTTSYVSCIFADPFDGPTPQDAVLSAVNQLLDMGCYEISLGDTLGVGVPNDVRHLLNFLFQNGVSPQTTAVQFHDTYGQALGNVWEAFQCGVRTFDSSVSGLGGCPFAPGAQGNVATEDVVYLFENAGINTGVDIKSLAKTGAWISQELKRQNQSRAGPALLKSRVPGVTPTTDKALAIRKLWTTIEETSGLKIFRLGHNMKILLDRPENGNALTTSMILQLTKTFENIATDESVRRAAIIGTGRYFCRGMDVGKEGPVAKGQQASDSQFVRLTRLLEVIYEAPPVTIAALN
jgi:hydroxymethylglutaryl-CoA lyase